MKYPPPTFPPTVLPPKRAPHLLGIDVTATVHRCFHATLADGRPEDAVRVTLQSMAKLLRIGEPTHVAFAMDPGGPTWRDEELDSYKAGRPPKPPELTAALARVTGIILAEGLPLLTNARYEADDMLATACVAARRVGLPVVLGCHDKDMRQLVDATTVVTAGEECNAVTLWDGSRSIGAKEVTEIHGVAPARMAEWLAIAGDTVDGIPGVVGIGGKGAAELLNRTHRSLEQLIAAPDWIADKTMRAKVKACASQLAVYLRITRLVTNAVPVIVDELQCDPLVVAEQLLGAVT